MGRLFHIFLPFPLKMLVVVGGRLLAMTLMLGWDDIAYFHPA